MTKEGDDLRVWSVSTVEGQPPLPMHLAVLRAVGWVVAVLRAVGWVVAVLWDGWLLLGHSYCRHLPPFDWSHCYTAWRWHCAANVLCRVCIYGEIVPFECTFRCRMCIYCDIVSL